MHCCCSTHRPSIEWGCNVVHTQLMCNISSHANLHTGYSTCSFPGDIMSYPFNDLWHQGSVQRWAAIQYPSIWIQTYNKETLNVRDLGVCFSARLVHGLQVECNTTDRDDRMGYKMTSILPKDTATCNILNHTPIYSISLLVSIILDHYYCSQNKLTNGSPPITANIASQGGLFHSQ